MKKKSPRGIPKFSSKPVPSHKVPDSSKEQRGLPTHGSSVPPAQVKPWATSAKSGRRGG